MGRRSGSPMRYNSPGKGRHGSLFYSYPLYGCDSFPHKGGEAREEGVETPVLSEVCNNDGPDWAAGQHGPPRGHQCGLHTYVHTQSFYCIGTLRKPNLIL